MIKWQFAHLPYRRFDEPFLAKAKRSAEKPAQRLDVAIALVIEDVDPLAACDYQRPDPPVQADVRVRMQYMRDIARLNGVGTNCHLCSVKKGRRRGAGSSQAEER